MSTNNKDLRETPQQAQFCKVGSKLSYRTAFYFAFAALRSFWDLMGDGSPCSSWSTQTSWNALVKFHVGVYVPSTYGAVLNNSVDKL